MPNFDKTVPFDPGYSDIAFSFPMHMDYVLGQYRKVKNNNQKKFMLMQLEKQIIDVIEKATSFYLGCILWGGYISFRFKDTPKEIEGNRTSEYIENSEGEWDSAAEVKYIKKFISSFERDCQYLLKRKSKLSENIMPILDSYEEFVDLNGNFVETKSTSDVKVPKVVEHFSNYNEQKLDVLCDLIYKVIENKKIEALLEIGFYE